MTKILGDLNHKFVPMEIMDPDEFSKEFETVDLMCVHRPTPVGNVSITALTNQLRWKCILVALAFGA